MTVQAQNSTQYYNGPISVGTVLSIKNFTFIDNSHVSAKIRNEATTWKYGVDYKVEGAGTLIRQFTVLKEVPADKVLAIYLDVPITQGIAPEEGGKFPASTQEFTLDKLTYICQMLQEQISRSVQVSVDTTFNGVLPELISDRTFKINSTGDGLILSKYDPDQAFIDTENFKKAAEAAAEAAKNSENAAKQSELNAKASETNAKASEVAAEQIKTETQSIADKALQDISTAKTEAVAEVNSTKDAANVSVNSTKDQAIKDVQAEGATQRATLQPYVDKAKDWATKMGSPVEGALYSSKYYAERAQSVSGVTHEQLMANFAYKRGEVNSDVEGYVNILKRAHSTFDKSKFDVVGSPNINNNGVFNNTNTNEKVNIQIPALGNNFIIECPIRHYGEKYTGSLNNLFSDSGINLRFAYGWGSTWYLDLKDTNGDIINGSSSYISYAYSTDKNYLLRLICEFKNDVYNIVYELYEEGILVKTLEITTDKKPYVSENSVELFIKESVTSTRIVDLKLLRIVSDGIPVFNGNKTGLYVAKPDNYEVVGSPTITEDGIASEFSNQNYFKTIQLSQLKGKSWEIHGKWINKGITTPNTTNVFFDFGGWMYWGSTAFNISTKNLTFNRKTGVSGDADNQGTGIVKKLDNIPSYIQFIYGFNIKTGNYYAKIEYDEGWEDLGTFTVVTENKELYYINEAPQNYIRIGTGSDNTYNKNAFDIYSFKVYIEGDLAYQTGLKIPYTETFEHPKVVDVAYRDRVQDLYEQTGEALFYTIDEQNQNFTLPSGDIYGMITKNREILDIVYPIGRPMPEENNVLLDNEVWLEGATVNIVDYPKLFKIYGTKYGGDGTTTFKLPDMRGRTLWGSPDGSNGYIESKLPNIKGALGVYLRFEPVNTSGAFTLIEPTTGLKNVAGQNYNASNIAYFNASDSNPTYSDDVTIVQPPAFKVRWKTRFQ